MPDTLWPIKMLQLGLQVDCAVFTLQERSSDGGDGQWYCFDDNTVEPWDVADLEKDCFGGKYIPAETFPGMKQQVKLLPGHQS